ncbi:MAG TPA: hypothetical protein VNL38_02155, partial [Candidatus Nitrosotenuis sp.]|nr:hypothetical protein [Candidatus Nitrosotenuis sp.]
MRGQRFSSVFLASLLTIAAVVLIHLLSTTSYRLANPGVLLVVTIAFAAYHGGGKAAALSTAVAMGYFLWAYSMPGHLFRYTHEDSLRLLLNFIVFPLTGFAVATMRRRAQQAIIADKEKSALQVQLDERARAEAKVRASHDLLRKLIDGVGPYMFIGLLTSDGTVLEANRPALEAGGLKLEDVL